MNQPEIDSIRARAREEITSTTTQEALENARITYLGRQGIINDLFQNLAEISGREKAQFGKKVNSLKQEIDELYRAQYDQLTSQSYRDLESDWIDVTEPGKKPALGSLHPLTLVIDDVIEIFKKLGYHVADGPEIESDEYNFTKLNFPPDHPARDTQDTFYLDTTGTDLSPGSVILRTHTSARQGRIMEKTEPPIRVIVPGKCYRNDTVDASHGFEFWQVEGFVIEQGVTMADLLGTLDTTLKMMLGPDTKTKFACTYFPFVEPGVDSYVNCTLCAGSGCSYCKQSGWIEIMPAGMIHPNVFKASGYDPDKTRGFAFAIGLSRIANLKYGIEDLRMLSTPDLDIIRQF